MADAGALKTEDIPAASAPPSADRARQIAALAKGEDAGHFVPYRGGFLQAPVIAAPQELLLYRVENGRLIAELEEHVRAQGHDLAGLAADQETLPVQRLLHGFLADKAKDPKGPILQELRRLAQQTEPLLITAEGVMVNGNRRLAAMRELLTQDPDRYAGFGRVSVAVLPPDAAAADVESVEAALQLAPETKLGYGWINRRLKIRRQRDDIGVPLPVMLEAYRMDDPAQLDRELAELALAEDYLAGFAGAPGRYSLVADAEALFVGLRARLAVLDEPLRRIWRLAGFAMISGRKAVEGPMDRQFPFAEPQPTHMPVLALRRFAEEHDLVATQDDPYETTPLPGDVADSLGVIFADPNHSSELAPELFGLIERLRSEFQEQSSPTRILKLLEKIRHSIGKVQPDKLTDRQRLALRSELAAIQAQAAVLLGDAVDAHPPARRGGLSGLLRR